MIFVKRGMCMSFAALKTQIYAWIDIPCIMSHSRIRYLVSSWHLILCELQKKAGWQSVKDTWGHTVLNRSLGHWSLGSLPNSAPINSQNGSYGCNEMAKSSPSFCFLLLPSCKVVHSPQLKMLAHFLSPCIFCFAFPTVCSGMHMWSMNFPHFSLWGSNA